MLVGEGDHRLRETLERMNSREQLRVVVDFSQVPYIDSSVLGQLVYGYSLLRENGGDLKILNPSPRIKDLLDVTRLASVFEIFDDRSAVLESWD
jgi:anti-sigma B factor antagonist